VILWAVDILHRLEGGGFQLLRRWEQQLRFAVHGPGYPVASPRSHGVPRRDVDGRVHISVAGVSAGGAPEARLALTRASVHLPARRAPLARERGSDLLHPAGRLVLQAVHQQAPPRPQDAPVEPGLLADITARILRCAPGGPGQVRDGRTAGGPRECRRRGSFGSQTSRVDHDASLCPAVPWRRLPHAVDVHLPPWPKADVVRLAAVGHVRGDGTAGCNRRRRTAQAGWCLCGHHERWQLAGGLLRTP
jgi:hypothetical protein